METVQPSAQVWRKTTLSHRVRTSRNCNQIKIWTISENLVARDDVSCNNEQGNPIWVSDPRGTSPVTPLIERK